MTVVCAVLFRGLIVVWLHVATHYAEWVSLRKAFCFVLVGIWGVGGGVSSECGSVPVDLYEKCK